MHITGWDKFLVSLVLLAAYGTLVPNSAPAQELKTEISPILGIQRDGDRGKGKGPQPKDPTIRSIDGSGNNLDDPSMGAAHTPLLRRVASDYADGVSALAGSSRSGPREISNAVSAQKKSISNRLHASNFLWLWGQFLDHDIDLTDGTDPPEPANIAVPTGDHYFDPEGTGAVVIPFNRSIYESTTGTGTDNPRQQVNEITSWIDGSNVYGSDAARAAALRTNDGTGRLRTSAGNLLPFNTAGLPNAGGNSSSLFLAGDVRANEHVGLTTLHTLFVREHNRLAGDIAKADPELTGDQIYETARRIVGAQIQVITYREYLPALLGPDVLDPYGGYDPNVNASISNIFATAAYRYGHSAVGPMLPRLDKDGKEIPEGHLSLRDAFFAPHRITGEGGIDPILRGAANQTCEAVDPFIIDTLRNFLFGNPGAGGFDLAALNIQRGRDHGLPSYNAARGAYGLSPAESFDAISSNPQIQKRLASAYEGVGDMDLWAGGLSEDPLPESHVGRLLHTIIKEQFEALRSGDRFWYSLSLSAARAREVEKTRLSDIIRRNTGIENEIPDDVFHVVGHGHASNIK